MFKFPYILINHATLHTLPELIESIKVRFAQT